jgi:hypothetical protein
VTVHLRVGSTADPKAGLKADYWADHLVLMKAVPKERMWAA